MGQLKRPPLGLMPRWLFGEKRRDTHPTQHLYLDYWRYQQIFEAVKRYMDAGKPVPPEWIEEGNEIMDTRFYHNIAKN